MRKSVNIDKKLLQWATVFDDILYKNTTENQT